MEGAGADFVTVLAAVLADTEIFAGVDALAATEAFAEPLESGVSFALRGAFTPDFVAAGLEAGTLGAAVFFRADLEEAPPVFAAAEDFDDWEELREGEAEEGFFAVTEDLLVGRAGSAGEIFAGRFPARGDFVTLPFMALASALGAAFWGTLFLDAVDTLVFTVDFVTDALDFSGARCFPAF